MKKAVKAFLSGFILKIIPLCLYKIIVPRKLTCIFYHVVSDESLPHIQNIYPVISTQQFRGGLDYLLSKYQFVGYDEIEDAYLRGRALPPNAAHLTFDDGFIECYSVIRPILKEYNIPATFFITTDFIGNKVLFPANLKSFVIEKVNQYNDLDFSAKKDIIEKKFKEEIKTKQDLIIKIKKIDRHDRDKLNLLSETFQIDHGKLLREKPLYLNEKQIIEMHSEGFTMGSHSRSHYKLGLVDEELMKDEIVEATRIIRKITGQKSIPFAFPNSGYGVSRDKLKEVRDMTPELGLIFDSKGFNQDADFVINRVWGEHPQFIVNNKHHQMRKILHKYYQEAFFLQLRNIFRGSKL